jgi:hypothetical protein
VKDDGIADQRFCRVDEMAAPRLEVGIVEVERGMDRGSGRKTVVKVDLREVLAGEAVLRPELC